jgi:hypothetical protein
MIESHLLPIATLRTSFRLRIAEHRNSSGFLVGTKLGTNSRTECGRSTGTQRDKWRCVPCYAMPFKDCLQSYSTGLVSHFVQLIDAFEQFRCFDPQRSRNDVERSQANLFLTDFEVRNVVFVYSCLLGKVNLSPSSFTAKITDSSSE